MKKKNNNVFMFIFVYMAFVLHICVFYQNKSGDYIELLDHGVANKRSFFRIICGDCRGMLIYRSCNPMMLNLCFLI